MSDPVLRLDRFSYRYPTEGGPAGGLKNVSLAIEPGEFVLVCGASGSGKSTLLRAAGGLVPHHFGGTAAGEATVCGRDLRTHGPAELAAYCGTVLQDPETQIVMGEVRYEIAFPLENLGWAPSDVDRAVDRTADALGIRHLLRRRTAELSGGELQRVVLAAAIAAGPALLALDEPTSQLDPVAAGDLLAAAITQNRDHDTAVLIAEHRIERVLPAADRVLVFERGELVCDAPPREFLGWAAATESRAWLLTPSARLCSLANITPLPVDHAEAANSLSLISEGSPLSVTASSGIGEATGANAVELEFRDTAYSFPGCDGSALTGIDLSLRAGERLALMGANGSGKSTLLRLARGLIKPSDGTVEASGSVGLLLQNPNDYLIHERVADEAPVGALTRYGLESYADRDPRDLSGGERQRLALAIVTQENPSVLLLDEPTRGMDRRRKSELLELLRAPSLNDCAVVLATHDVEFAAEFARRVVVLEDGRVAADGPAVEVLATGPLATETARLMPGIGVLTPAHGAAALADAAASAQATARRMRRPVALSGIST
ncbi:MAG: ATP-binding cassette domain-containing protein [Actinobacteria bacterium]|nr:ATP-binding cassette domain-containing protein [Actinomycetota bacterium]